MRHCGECGSSGVIIRPIEKYHYRESGLANVWLHGGGALEFKCDSCGWRSIAIQKEVQLLQVIAVTLLMRPGWLRGLELRYLRHACGLTQQGLADKLDVRRATVVDWERGEVSRLERAGLLHLRMVLLREFQRSLLEPGNDNLEARHKHRLGDFARGFSEEFGRLFVRRVRVSLALQKRDNVWEPLPVDA